MAELWNDGFPEPVRDVRPRTLGDDPAFAALRDELNASSRSSWRWSAASFAVAVLALLVAAASLVVSFIL